MLFERGSIPRRLGLAQRHLSRPIAPSPSPSRKMYNEENAARDVN
jgi:hypothetical protein